MKEHLTPFVVVNRSGVGLTIYAFDAADALLRRCTALAAAAELAEQQGLPRRFDWRALPATVEPLDLPAVSVDDLYAPPATSMI